MGYRLRYTVNVDWVPQGVGLGTQADTVAAPGALVAGPAQTLAFFNADTSSLPPYSATFTPTDVTNFTNSMAADIATQLNANLTRIQGFSSGGG